MNNIDDLLTFTQKTAVSAGKLAREKFNQPRTITNKGYRDFLTDADLAAQTHITTAIRAAFPEHGFLAEEEDSNLPTSGPVIWIIDPIDGTTNYSRQQPIYCVSIAARDASGQIVAGAIYDPMQDELFSAGLGCGSTLNGEPIRVSQESVLDNAIVGIDWSRHQERRQSVLDILHEFADQVHVVRAIGSAALAMAWVAAGRFDLYMNFSLMPWDVAAADLIIREAGGELGAPQGGPLVWSNIGMSCVVSNGRLHQPFLNTFAASL